MVIFGPCNRQDPIDRMVHSAFGDRTRLNLSIAGMGIFSFDFTVERGQDFQEDYFRGGVVKWLR